MSHILDLYISKGTKLYGIDEELRFIEYTYLKIVPQGEGKQPRHLVSTEAGYEFTVTNQFFNQLSLSKITILTELEERLRFKLEYIHSLMRKHKLKFNPLDTPNIIYANNPFPNTGQFESKPLSQYSELGDYIHTFPSMSAAAQYMSEITETTKSTYLTNLSRAAHNQIKCSGYYWSYEKVNKLKF